MRILIADDDSVSRRLIESRLLKWGYEVIATSNGKDALDVLRTEGAPGLVILDWVMPGIDGVDVCRTIRAERKLSYTYIMLLTSNDRDEDLVAGMEAGADDYLIKPCKPNELKVRLRAGRRILELQNQLLEAQDALVVRATHDSLTGLWNHEEIISAVTRELARANRENGNFSLIMADLDHFKQINDTFGHLAGDEVLREISRRFLSVVRAYDSVGRYGGEEFLIVLPCCDIEEAQMIGKRMLGVINQEAIHVNGKVIHLTISIGAATYRQNGVCEAAELIQMADEALYGAKKNGRNRMEMAKL